MKINLKTNLREGAVLVVPELLQDDNRKLFKWLATRLDSRQRAREAAAAIAEKRAKESANA